MAVLVGVAVVVQLVFPYRHDWPAHLVAGGGLVLIVASAVPRRFSTAAGLVGYGVVFSFGWITERLVFGPPDTVDVAFTLAGALVAFQAAGDIAGGAAPLRRAGVAWGAALIVVGLAFRYGTSVGPT